MTEAQLREIIALGREQQGVEFKDAIARTDRLFFAKVARAMIGMANHRDGGTVIIGVAETGGELVVRGLESDVASTWNSDHVADALATYADPIVRFEVEEFQLDGKLVKVIQVREFDDVPVVCTRNYATRTGEVVLREGALYLRPRKKPETAEVATYADMRDIIDLATDKSVRRFVARAHAVGFRFESTQKSDEQRFAEQRVDLA